MRLFFYDTETTGIPLFDQPSDDPRQPHLVQVAAVVVDSDTKQVVHGIDMIVRPDGWVIPEDVAAVHGITTERAMAVGVPEALVVDVLWDLWLTTHLRVAHNQSFDARLVRIALKRFRNDELADQWKEGPAECTARMATPICALPPTDRMKAAKRFHHKTPSLSEAHQHLLGRPLENAHSALADVRGCIDIYWAMKEREAIPA